jgi:hypothetical protein
MRVVHVDTGTEMRGGQWQCLRLLEAVRSDALLLAPAGSPLAQRAAACGIEFQAFSVGRLLTLARDCDLVHVHDARAHSWAAAAGGAPLVVSRRVAFPVHDSRLSRWKYSRGRHYIAVSECVRRVLMASHVPGDRITVVYDGVPVPERPASGDFVVAPASADPMKAGTLAREAAKLAGIELRLSDDLEHDLPRARAFIYLTHAEGLGSAVLLAMAHGVAVVASRVGGIPEIVEDGVTGLLTDNEPQAIAAAICGALQRAGHLGANARRAVEQRFTVRAMVEGTLAVYRKVLAC